jgi:hypothetical protein
METALNDKGKWLICTCVQVSKYEAMWMNVGKALYTPSISALDETEMSA